ncbi:PHA/PHB synthase family protein [Litoreibacter arenae]|uniref:Polyhydroxyalkanoic acid synthase n=1 Tax=Litoreibacter arenae DSM 19593 TaxID=1123360 RepID=S9RJE5_9RHOB|nr:alpha/beta fold hydrolase [Litoreibacter arenae]EPX78240.1 Polyhydroxyalkanoic acid synthase [Litoreibacter arenae DSM 19593]
MKKSATVTKITKPDTRRTTTPANKTDQISHQMDPVPPELGPLCATNAPDRFAVESMDRAVKAQLARLTQGISPFGLASTFFNWGLHLASSPGKQVQLAEKAMRKTAHLGMTAGRLMSGQGTAPCIDPLGHDDRFDAAEWQRWPYNMVYQNFLMTQQWWYNATNDIDGMSRRDEQVASFVVRQILDMMSPSNSLWTNPEVIAETTRTFGANLVQGTQNLIEDIDRTMAGKPPVGAEDYLPGREVAVTPGKVVYRTHLFELIQYAPQTKTVAQEPLLIVPAWIMKYYILDLSPHNSLVKYLVEQGFTVFMVSWRNPDAQDRDIGMDNYLDAVGEALDEIGQIIPDAQVHGVGYCLGGTLMSAKASQMARDGDKRLKTLSLFATQVDFEDPGELQLFISESQVSFLEHMMWDQGYLDTKQMAGAFQLLRSTDLIWSRYVHEYLMGRRQPMFDLMAWNSDATRMPYRMHSEYLRHMFLNNELAQGQYRIDGKPVAISDITAPMFCVSTTGDHVAPWKSVYKLHLLTDTDVTFVLTSGGHNAGIVSRPGHKGRTYQIDTATASAKYIAPDDWRAAVPVQDGSWWPEFTSWLDKQSSAKGPPPPMGAALGDAPGTFVLQR